MESFAKSAYAAWNGPMRAEWHRLAAIVLLALGAMFVAAPARSAPGLTALASRTAAPELALSDVDGKPVKLSELRGRVVVVNFWATWCPPCRKELPSLGRLQKLFKPEQLRVLAVNIGEDEETVFGFLPDPPFTILLDQKSATLRTWQVKGLPSTFVVDREGRIVLRAVGGREFDDAATVARLRELLQD